MGNQSNPFLKIKDLAEDDRPREKLLDKGRSTLTEAELIAILIGSGSSEHNAVELAQLILSETGNNLNELAKLSIEDLTRFKGIGEAKAINIVAALELGRRRATSSNSEQEQILSSRDVHEIMTPFLLDLQHEEFWIVLLNRSNVVIRKERISKGGISGTVADPKLIFKKSIEKLASGIILVHNHPSGNTKPSEEDINLTQKLSQAGKIMEIPVLDHIIFTNDGYFSFADEGLML